MQSKWSVVDKIKEIAKQSPEELEAFRKREVEAFIQSAPGKYQHRLRGIQFQVDAQRLKHPKPLGSCVAIFNMMQNSLNQLNSALRGQEPDNIVNKGASDTCVIPFR